MSGKASGVNPEEKSGAGVPKAVRRGLQHRSGNSCDGTGATLHGLLPFTWITSVTWRGGTCCMGNSLSSISPLPRSVFYITLAQVCLPFFHLNLAQVCLPYHHCPGLSSISPLSRFSISPLSRSVFHITVVQVCLPYHLAQVCLPLPRSVFYITLVQIFHITLVQVCLPYHPCSGLPYHPCPGLSSISPLSRSAFHITLPRSVFHITLVQVCLP